MKFCSCGKPVNNPRFDECISCRLKRSSNSYVIEKKIDNLLERLNTEKRPSVFRYFLGALFFSFVTVSSAVLFSPKGKQFLGEPINFLIAIFGVTLVCFLCFLVLDAFYNGIRPFED